MTSMWNIGAGAFLLATLVSIFAAATAALADNDVGEQVRHDELATDTPRWEGGEVTEADLTSQPSLHSVMAYAVQRNPGIQAAREAWNAERERITRVSWYENLEVSVRPDTGRTTETRAGALGNGVEISQPIPFPGKLTLRGKIAEREASVAYEVFQATLQEVMRQVRAQYADYYLAFRSLEVTADTTRLVREFAEIAEAKYRVGDAPQQDVIQSHEKLSRLDVERIAYAGNRETALGSLNALLDRAPRAPVGNPQELEAGSLDYELADLVNQADRERPELRAQDELIEARQRALTLSKMGYLPDFKLGAGYVEVKGGSNPGFSRDGRDVWTATIGFSVPIWFNRVEAGVNEAHAKVLSERFRRRDLGNVVHDQIQRSFERVDVAARTEVVYRTTLIPQTEERINAARAAYVTGIADFLTLIDSLTSLEDVRLARFRAVRDYHQALADLERSVGRVLAPVPVPVPNTGTGEQP